ncbi:hypothetical protein DAPPUDRAFT_215008 [Daphnia pulex]|uniref:Annexin n=1 Tax=Daphnia pulex TaxID=6669 RepID=E9H191_DAPPU|nr:hypothetical protein DAPPUDRAFT_215008 [Daphnia pulex]|eukprot:EFX74402.1 hypothetical protein DAPPUDRAFT_215008 [Daphnia pulex]
MSLTWAGENNDYTKELPTVLPEAEFNAMTDAQTLRAAMKGFGTNEEAIIDILCYRSNAQRQSISKAFTLQFNRDLIADFKSELSGNFKKLILSLMMPPEVHCAKLLNKAMKGVGTNEDVLVEVFFSRPYDDIARIALAYECLYNTPLEKDVREDTSGPFQQLLLNALQRKSDQTSGHGDFAYDPVKAQEDARNLYTAGEGRIGTDENVFVDVFGFAAQCRRQTSEMFKMYKKISGKTIEQALKSEMSGDLLHGLKDIVEIVHNRPAFFAHRLELAMKGLGTNDNALIRIIVDRSEIDLVNIKSEYERIYCKTLLSSVQSETSGDYRRALICLIKTADD